MKIDDIFRLTADDIFNELNTSIKGLSKDEANARLQKYGYNEIKEVKKSSLLSRFLANFTHLLAILLWIASILSFIGGMPQLGWAIILVIIVNALFSFWQEFKAEQATESLKKMLPSYVKVIRDGHQEQILARELVPGDLIYLEEGDHIPADARLIEAFEMRTINAALTGESEPVRRTSDVVLDEDVSLLQSPNLVFMGTSVASGSGTAVVYATGMDTQFGKIASLTQTIKIEQSPLQRQLTRVAQVIAYLSLVMGVFFFLLGLLMGRSLVDTFMFAIGIITANVPEGLLPTVTLALAMGVQRMARRHALVKKLSSVETLGGATVICTDKTGTLTQNEMTVREIWTPLEFYNVSGIGYEPKGEFSANGRQIDNKNLPDELSLLLKIGLLCNNSRLVRPTNENPSWNIIGDPTEGSLVVLAEKAGYTLENMLREYPRVSQLPFDSRRKRMSSIHKSGKDIYVFTKGAPKETLSVCNYIFKGEEGVKKLEQSDIDKVIEQNDKFAESGLRVLAMAYKKIDDENKEYTIENTENDLIFVGLVAMMDPPRPEVELAVKHAHKAGIKIIMITGDYGLTAESIARRIGIIKGLHPRIIIGNELDKMTDEDLKKELKNKEIIFARVAPEHKMKVVAALKEMGEVVAVTGDGVNDSPALKRADIGIAMGKSGTDVAREVATMVLTDDNFASIVNAIEEGRAVYDNVRKFITYIFAHLTPEAIPYILFSLFNIPVPITVMQILAIDLGTETLPALALGVEPPEPGVMDRPPRSPKEKLLNLSLFLRGYVLLGLISSVAVLSGYFWVLYSGGWHWGETLPFTAPLAKKAATMSFLGIVIMQVANVFACRTEVASMFSVGFFKNKLLNIGVVFELVLTAILIYVPFLQKIFDTYPVSFKHWLFYLAFIPLLIGAEEIRKWILRKKINANK
ncbi:cation-transporting P-type ATPase [Thermoanaerobacterium sp. RBIITD]|uniref:cation-translocating P-type ATPase n=1 Tax=Thermoanaerobacterium sp. RBIITD TaxID=1550240 RepID=UPI000BBFFC70|nr:cation-transporting P-type ATPase [Thermoanaerobacterium sp. RBIITD]SNX54631.1 potassium and/or sodium efflux P-type ATPase [Thermoanaerobacterium sp. RBIITD]